MYWAWTHSDDISKWVNLFDLVDEEDNFKRRIFAFISGGILPIVSLGFIKSLMDYLDPNKKIEVPIETTLEEPTNPAELNREQEPTKDISKLLHSIDNSNNIVALSDKPFILKIYSY